MLENLLWTYITLRKCDGLREIKVDEWDEMIGIMICMHDMNVVLLRGVPYCEYSVMH